MNNDDHETYHFQLDNCICSEDYTLSFNKISEF